MKHYFSSKFKNIKGLACHGQKGFTLIETLITVAILAILLAVSIPSVIAIQKNLKMQELDDIARQIFLLSQSELTEMKSSGRLETFKKELEPTYSTQNLGILNERPSDYDKVGDGSQDDLKWKDFYYLNSTDTVLQAHIIRKVSALGAYLEGGSFIVELNPKTGDVYGAFYSPKVGLSYDDVLNLPNRGRDGRVSAQIGYYGGEAGSSASSTLPTNFLPTIEIINKEDLYIKFSCSNLQSLLRNKGSLKLTIIATDEDGSVVEGTGDWEKVFTGGTDFNIDATGNINYNILLDSLRPNEDFAKITGGKLKAGDNIKITAKLDYDNGKDPAITGVSVEQTFNSLFADKKDVDDTKQIDIAYLRHLNNLRESIYIGENVPTGKITLNQSLSIDFDVNNWGKEVLMPTKSKPALTSFVTITNKKLLERDANAPIIYNGNGNSLLNFPLIASAGINENVGLFSTAKGMTFKNMRMIDFSVNNPAYNNVGMLVGKLTGGVVTDVRAHLSTEDSNGLHHGINMPERLLKYKIVANNNVGGLIGVAEGITEIEGSFAAVPTDARANVGGLVGSFAEGKITNSYGSGNITATTKAGGLCGVILSNATVTNCYSTSNITANSYAGGLVGHTAGAACSFENTRSYGQVVKSDKTIDNASSGGLVGAQVAANTYNNCRYLQQGSYNNYEGATSRNYGTPTGYSNLVAKPANSVTNSHPYMINLFDKTFPFPMITMGVGTAEKLLPHYGDWPEETTMQTSLVYYERYENGDYGYYAKTSLSTIGGGESGGAANLWVIDTLRDEPCEEDGYALMTVFKLSSFKYRLENGAQQTVTTVEDATGAGAGKAPLIQSNVTVQFKKDDLTQSIENARVYQLPFKLQVAERGTNINRFFLKLNVYGYVGDKTVIDDFNFYYCPDFAKNSVNPEIGNTSIDVYPNDPGGQENPVYVRSPRQLNGLSRYNYYWNEGNNGGKKFYFLQETELDYTKYETNYCGVTYDLMDTSLSNQYRNRPIGRPTHVAGSQFRNIYDGNYKKIIDYRSEVYADDNYQFVGLFGEVRMCTLKNILLVASKPGEEGVPSSAYVKSYFNNGSYRSGTGALVGLVYVAPEDRYNGTEAKVENCFASGYDVETTTSLTNHSAVGGLVGYNFGTIINSSANSKTVVANSNNNAVRYLGGLVGSINGKSSIKNCYAGGVLKSNSKNVVVGGISAGYNSIYGWGNDTASIEQSIITSYSHCIWKNSNLKNGTFYPVAPQFDRITVNYCYYLTNSVEQAIADKFDTRSDKSEGKSTSELREMAGTSLPTELSDFGKAKNTYPWLIKGKNYPFPAIVKDKSGQLVHYGDWYLNEVIVPSSILVYYEKYRDEAGNVSFGYQFAETTGIKAYSGLKGNVYEITEAGYGVLVLDGENSLAEVWVNSKLEPLKTSETSFTVSGIKYNLQPLSNSDNLGKAGDTPNVVLRYNEIDNEVVTKQIEQQLYVNFNFAATVSLKQLVSTEASPTQVRTERQLRNLNNLTSGYYKMTHNIVISNFGEALTGNFENKGYTFDGGYVAGSGGAKYHYIDRWIGSNGNYIVGLKAPLFDASFAVVKNVALLGVDVTNSFAALMINNSGTIENCFVQGDVTGDNIAAGLVYSNSGNITSSYFSGKVTSPEFASGFVHTNSGEISNCYAVGAVNAVGSVNANSSGFLYTNNKTITNSYSAMRVTSNGKGYGFSATQNNGFLANCYWLMDNDRNINADIGDGGKVPNMNYSKFVGNNNESLLSKINANKLWATGRTAYPYPNGGDPTYPFPSLLSQDFYGNWPT